ncbi:transcriptional regulator family: Helix-loop-helix [Penicillium psychrosexuale]|uniref:transcriptional regulator family: Helix-loop-helix n=1 Tax=Penicillium psychrosexuale TaxID=1002107 RepID=UPI0025451793|nr:transcriptional regulator family: Helix-loop-helix [Penicillium psychrosexuale]KAJ5795794.1 transcriptional regulator family: Helix-loop-helix [Penicillium psychrosexuale]
MCIMACNRSNEIPNLCIDQGTYLSQHLSPQSRPADFFERPDPLAANWSYDNAIDLFSINPTDMEPVSFDFADSLTNIESKDLFNDPFASSGISGFSMPEDAASLSSEFESDDQTWPSAARQSIDSNAFETELTSNYTSSQPQTQSKTRSSPASWSSSPEMKQEEISTPLPSKPTTSTSRKTRSFSRDSNRSSTGGQDPQMRNAAKRAAHNIIEKRYRTNMNAKFVSLEQAISPSGVQKHTKVGAGSLKKSEILSNALTYIDSIQQENQALHKELAMLKQNLLPAGGIWRQSKNPRL